MPTINVEMMKQLLQEFDEKEALTGEEIKVIEQQIGELESRVDICRDRLQNLNEDKDRLAVMMSRYTGKGNTDNLKIELSKPRTSPKLAEATQQNLEAVKVVEATQSKKSVIEDLEPAAQPIIQQDETDKSPAAGNDDAIKSINDALKGLFRK